MVFKWIKKCVNRKLSRAQALAPAPQQPLPMPSAPPVQPQAIQFQPLSVPALPQPKQLDSPAYRVNNRTIFDILYLIDIILNNLLYD